MHGNKSQAQREKALARFERGRVDTLVATDVAARGIDVDGITHVINFDAPDDHDGYVHRVGRTARAGRTGIGITFVGPTRPATSGASPPRWRCSASSPAPACAGARRPRRPRAAAAHAVAAAARRPAPHPCRR